MTVTIEVKAAPNSQSGAEYVAEIDADLKVLSDQEISALAENIAEGLLARLVADQNSGELTNTRPGLILKVRPDTPEALLGDLIARIVRPHAGRFQEAGFLPAIRASFGLTAKRQPPSSEAPTEDHRRYIDAASRLWQIISEMATEQTGEDLRGDELVNFAIRSALEDSEGTGDYQGTIVAVGVWLGDELVRTGQFEWASITFGDDHFLGVVSAEGTLGNRQYLPPFSIVGKRLDEGECFDARGLVDTLLERVSQG